ncbi:hypothetical protein BCV70DRAFT_83120 [Testicularia cyperi]|uniref:Uncharacterized protein n=1 Tax=Testicularia cyperi TaxID=1882483 RepID=A0A317XRB8_9BASI|nr:hypothetical protein BCV70DRAFT_83120 [Testicularia cyperi]
MHGVAPPARLSRSTCAQVCSRSEKVVLGQNYEAGAGVAGQGCTGSVHAESAEPLTTDFCHFTLP